MARGRIQGLPNVLSTPYYLRNRSSYELTHILSIDRKQKPVTNFGKSSRVRVVRTLESFQGTHILGASRGLLCDSSAVLFS